MVELLLGIDIGSYSSKGVLCGIDGTIVAELRIPHQIQFPRPGFAEQDAQGVWWHDLKFLSNALIKLVPRGSQVSAVGVSGIGPCVLPVDKNGKPLRPAILYGIDTRATQQITLLEEKYSTEEFRAFCGSPLNSQSGGPKIMWIKQFEPEIYQKTDKFLTTSSYLVHRLTGQYVIDMHTASYFSPLFNFEAMSWDDRYADGIVELQRLPKPVWCDGIAGEVTHAASSETGIPAGIPVTNGALDGLAESIGAGVIRPGQLMIMYGSTAGFYLPLTSLIRSNELWLLAGALKNQLAFGGGLATSGSATTWFRNQFGQDLVVNEEHGGVNAFAALAEIARQSKPGANGLIFLPYLSGERTPLFDPQARGIYAGLTLSHSRADLYRALLEGTAYAIRHNLEAIERTGALVDEIICVGGGANNRFWLQLVSDVCGIRQVIPNQTIGAAYGDAFLAGLASGLIPDISYLKSQWVHQADEVMPNPKAKPLYDQLYALFKSLYLDTKETTHMLANMQC